MPCKTSIFSLLFRLRILYSSVQPSSRLILRLYAKRFAHSDKLIGTHEIAMPVESQTGWFILRELSLI